MITLRAISRNNSVYAQHSTELETLLRGMQELICIPLCLNGRWNTGGLQQWAGRLACLIREVRDNNAYPAVTSRRGNSMKTVAWSLAILLSLYVFHVIWTLIPRAVGP
jgi:hypothetical protein